MAVCQASLRDARRGGHRDPWVETNGNRRGVATRRARGGGQPDRGLKNRHDVATRRGNELGPWVGNPPWVETHGYRRDVATRRERGRRYSTPFFKNGRGVMWSQRGGSGPGLVYRGIWRLGIWWVAGVWKERQWSGTYPGHLFHYGVCVPLVFLF